MRVCIVGFVVAARAIANDYYVDLGGKDSNNGLAPATAWKSLAKVSSFDFQPGDRILLKGGQVFVGKLDFVASDAGTAAQPVIVTSFGTGRATIDAGAGDGVFVWNAGGFELANLEVRGSGPASNDGDGITFYVDQGGGVKLAHVELDGVEVHGFGGFGVSFGSGSASSPSKSGFVGVRVSNVEAWNNALAGLAMWGPFSASSTTWAHADVVVADSRFHDNPGDPTVTTTNTGSGAWLSDVDGATIEYCEAFGNGALCANPNGGPVGLWVYDANDVVIQHCESHHNRTGPNSVDGGGFDLDGGTTNSVIQYCWSHDNDGPGFLLAQYSGARPFADNTVRYNVSQNDARRHTYGAINLWNGNGANGIRDCDVYNNTVFLDAAGNPNAAAIDLATSVTNVAVRNNIFVTVGGAPVLRSVAQTTVLFQQNDYFASGATWTAKWAGVSHPTLAAWRNATGQEYFAGRKSGTMVNPSLVAPGGGATIGDPHQLTTLNAYRLSSNSALINSALNLPVFFGIDVGAQDFFGDSIPSGSRFDFGAHEW
jgi:hypothetical protein